ncbi:hypothetical protein M427DRAFT_454360 [Gonapodya prolifera JEL478]|uniref:Uncharacterized protein n=1 Tax=Gonapodya prolifera (strain JEL478) TaxID=1344416 RepID=A0A139ASD1_GONPJ|nr:hypothetical protein M427DRAFT_454360 [Gonapodya prolifera JEL478]|eukprot:KXS19609.1 hypothetical protein M427DRAFT_454360 [Gonapodya prolifera JEL478]
MAKGAVADARMAIVVLRGAHLMFGGSGLKPAVRKGLRDAFREIGGVRAVAGKLLRDVVAQVGSVPVYSIAAVLDHVVRTAVLELESGIVTGRLGDEQGGRNNKDDRADWIVRALDVLVVVAGRVEAGEVDPADFVEIFIRTVGTLVDLWWGIRSGWFKALELVDVVELVDAVPWAVDARWRLSDNILVSIAGVHGCSLQTKIRDRVIFLIGFLQNLRNDGVRDGSEWAEDASYLHKALQTAGVRSLTLRMWEVDDLSPFVTLSHHV